MENKSTSSLNWHDIPGYEGLYQFNWHTNQVKRLDTTVVDRRCNRNIKERILQNNFCKGRFFVILSKGGKTKCQSLGQITLSITQGEQPQGMFCCHNDGNQLNNLPENVRYGTPMENTIDSMKHGTHTKPMKPVKRSDGKVFDSIRQALRYMGKTSVSNIGLCCRGKYKTAYGYCWEFIN